jgi:hypothetical protein
LLPERVLFALVVFEAFFILAFFILAFFAFADFLLALTFLGFAVSVVVSCVLIVLRVPSVELRNLSGGYFFAARMRRTEVRPIWS